MQNTLLNLKKLPGRDFIACLERVRGGEKRVMAGFLFPGRKLRRGNVEEAVC
jgi:hypothetical protein